MSAPLVWIVDDDESILWVLKASLKDKPYEVVTFDNPELALFKLKDGADPKLILTDIRMPQMDGLTFLEAIHQISPKLPVIVMSAHADLDSVVASLGTGAFEFLPKPFEIDQVEEEIEKALRRALPKRKSRSDEPPARAYQIVGQAPSMQEVFRIIGRVADLNVPVLITGETGTGKELVARALHDLSSRKHRPFVALNTAAIPRDLLESELFGHERGAFTGAHNQYRGRFEQAEGGTLFLDEIGDMPVELQTRLLRVLNDGVYYRVGGSQPLQANVRILAATHQNMEKLVQNGRFREDLLYRLNVFRVKIPPLRERQEDIVPLLNYYMDIESRNLKLPTHRFDAKVESYLSTLEWPGNVRQLRALCTWLTVMSPAHQITLKDLPLEYQPNQQNLKVADGLPGDWKKGLALEVRELLQKEVPDIQRLIEAKVDQVLIEESMAYTHFNRLKAADKLGWGRNTLTRKIKQLNLDI